MQSSSFRRIIKKRPRPSPRHSPAYAGECPRPSPRHSPAFSLVIPPPSPRHSRARGNLTSQTPSAFAKRNVPTQAVSQHRQLTRQNAVSYNNSVGETSSPPETERSVHMDPQHPPSRSQHPRLLEKYGAYCQGCGCDFTDNPSALEVDHIWPRSEGGTDAYENLTLLCPPCNRTKSDTMTITGLQQHIGAKAFYDPKMKSI